MTTQDVPTSTGDHFAPPLNDMIAATTAWWQEEEQQGTLVDDETLWREAYLRYQSILTDPAHDFALTWASLASRHVADSSKAPHNERAAMSEAADLLGRLADRPVAEDARALHTVAERHDVEPSRILGLLGPGVGYPWTFPRSLWNPAVVGPSLEALLAAFEWQPDREPKPSWLIEQAAGAPVPRLVSELRDRAPVGSDLDRMLGAINGLTNAMEAEGRDISVIESRAFLDALAGHGLGHDEVERLRKPLSVLREAVVLLASYRLYESAERSLAAARQVRDDDANRALAYAARAANLYKRLGVAQQYPERLLERHQDVSREMEEIRADSSDPDRRADQVLLVSTFNSPADLQRLLLSVSQELMAFAYGKRVHVIVNDGSTPELRARNGRIIDNAVRAGLSISHWGTDRKEAFLDQLNRDVFPDGNFDVRALAGMPTPGERGIPYGRLRNFLRLVALKEMKELGLEDPVLTWLDQDNEIGALVLTKAGKLSKRHVFNYFDQKSSLFEDDNLRVAGGGYTNDALEGVEKFWVAWGILGRALELAQNHDPQGPPILPADPDITRFRPWDQPDTLERLPREGEDVTRLSDQILLLLTTLLGTFRGKYDNQVQIYHPWTFGHVDPAEESLVEERRAFAGMPGGNTTFATEVLKSPTPFITVAGRGEDIMHLWQLEASHGVGTVYLTHTPALHTRNVRAGRNDLMDEIIDSFNGRILREPPLLWGTLAAALAGRDHEQAANALMADTEEQVNNLRTEAHSRISEVSGFATAIEPYLDETGDFWWIEQARHDDRYRGLLTELREMVGRFKDADRYHERAEEKLLRLDEVRELTDEFVAAYPHWSTVVAHLAGDDLPGRAASEAASVSPSEGYGSTRPAMGEATAPTEARRAFEDLPLLDDPAPDPAWHEVVSSSLSLYRRWETGRAQKDLFSEWPQRLDRLRDIFSHYVTLAGNVPDFVWTKLFRDALLIPSSSTYGAVSELLSDEYRNLDAGERNRELGRIAAGFGADEELLRAAVDVPQVRVAAGH